MRTQRPADGARRITQMALLTAIALTIFMAEAQIPVPIPIPGIKLGLANIVTVYAVFALGPGDALLSLGGGLLCWLVLLLLSRLLTWKQIWLCSPISAVFHNLGQLLVAAALLGSWTVLAYLPYLVVAGAASGLFTGLCAQLLAGRLKGLGRR